MIEYIAHRINTSAELRDLSEGLGVELDLRDCGERLILRHDPFGDGEEADRFFGDYGKRGTLIANIKSTGIEWRVIELLKKNGIEKYFLLDSSFPMIHALASKDERRVAMRFSEFEGLDTVMNLKELIDWVWVDCFTFLPLDRTIFEAMKSAQLKLCLVSPELQGHGDDIERYARQLRLNDIVPDAICTKAHNISRWQTAWMA